MSTVEGITECQVCGEECTYLFDSHTHKREVFCHNPECDENTSPLQKFLKALGQDDFAIGDSFWIDGFEFEVISFDGQKKLDMGIDPYQGVIG